MRESFLIHKDSLCILDKMTNEQAGIFIKAIYHFHKNMELPDGLDFALEMAVTPFINQFKRDSKKYESVVERRKIAGAKGGLQKVANLAIASNCLQKLANPSYNDNVNDSDSDSESESDNVNAPALFSHLENYLPTEKEKKEKSCEQKEKEMINNATESVQISNLTFNSSNHLTNFLNEENGALKSKKCVSYIFQYLNEKIGKKYSLTNEDYLIIFDRLQSYSYTDLINVIDCKTTEWIGEEKTKKWLVPTTLFKKEKFEKYLDQANEFLNKKKEEQKKIELIKSRYN